MTSEIDPAASGSFVTDAQVLQLRESGFLALPVITSPQDVAAIRAILESLFAAKAGYAQGANFNLVGTEEDSAAPAITMILNPQQFADELKRTEFFANATAVARQILGAEARYAYDMVLLKPGVDGPATPWHQDEASHDPRFDYDEVHLWMPLQPVNEENGCIHFIAGSHRGEVLPHRSPNNDPKIHVIECYEGFDAAQAVSCPLPAGGCTIHLARTLHYSGPNRSHAPRYAYVLVFERPRTRTSLRRTFPWQKEKNTARMRRAQEWELRHGWTIALVRKALRKLSHAHQRFFDKP